MKRATVAASLVVLLCSQALAADLPDSSVTPGATNASVTQANIAVTICIPGWTKTIRPPASYTTKLKLLQLRSGPYKSD